MPCFACSKVPAADFCLHWFCVFVTYFQQAKRAGALDRLSGQRAGCTADLDRIARTVVTALGPDVDAKWLARDEHLATGDNGTPRLVHHFGLDLVTVVMIGMKLLGQSRIDFDFDGAVRSDRNFALSNDFGLSRCAPEPPRMRGAAPPACPAGIPGILLGKPPVTRSVQPIPRHWRVPSLVVVGPQDFVFYFGVDDRLAKVVLRRDRGGNAVAELQWHARGIDDAFKLRLFVFFDTKRSTAVVGYVELILSQSSTCRNFPRALQSAISIGGKLLAKYFFFFRIVHLNEKRLACIFRFVF